MDTVTCPNCGTANPPDSRFCAKCGTTLSMQEDAAAQAPATATPLPVPPPGEVPAEPPRPNRTPLWIALGVVGVVILGGLLWLALRETGPTIKLPDTVAGQPRLTSSLFEDLAQTIANQDEFGDEKPLVGIYGTETSPAIMVFAFDSVPLGEAPDESFDMFARGFEESGGSVDRSSITTEVRDSTTYHCASYSATEFGGSVCTWLDGETFGVVMTFDQSLPAGIDLAAEVRDATVS